MFFRLALLSLLAACAPRQELVRAGAPVDPVQIERIFLVTDRALPGVPMTSGGRGAAVSRFAIDVSVPPDHRPGRVEFEQGPPDPRHDFAVAEAAALPDGASLRAEVARAGEPGADIVVFVHGYNMTVGEAVYRHGQIARDFDTRGPQVTFSWASAADPLAYVRDRDSIDIARDALENLLVDLGRGDRRVLLVAHSMGAQLVTETLRQMAIGRQDRTLDRLSGVALLSPDFDVDLFEAQLRRIDPLPQPFVVFLSERDRVLGLSARLAGQRERLGSTADAERLRRLGVSVAVLTGLSGQGANEHLLATTSPQAIAVLSGLARTSPDVWAAEPTVLDLARVAVTGTAP